MPLQVWLPLLGNTDNQGMSENIFTVSNSTYITVDSAGKLGQCYKFNSTESNNGIYSPDNGFMNKYINNHSFSLCAWVNIASDVLSTPVICLSYGLRLVVGNTSAARLNLYNSAGQINCMSSVALNDGKWHHFVGTYDVDTNKLAVYVDGVNTGNATYPSDTYASSWANGLFIGRDPNSAATTITDSALFRGKMQDVRIYDHALSAKEVNEIAKGLFVHYPFNDSHITDNLFLNGFGQDGLLGWDRSSYSTTEIPPNQSTIKASYTTNNTTTPYLPISHDTTYTFSEYMKASASSGTTYPSIIPYDIDKKRIENFNCSVGFNSNWSSTLSQPLNPGDTVVHAVDLSAWNTDTTSHYYYVAVFGYEDSTGHVYKDFTYTQDSLKFGTQTDKSNLDKTTNTITLLSPYTGKPRPAGTTICQATAGSVYYYPFGGINVTTITDWTYKSTVINPCTTYGRLFCAQYIQYLAYPSAYHAGIKLVANNDNKFVYDSSGFGNTGVATAGVFPSIDTPRNTISTRFTSGSHITIPNLSNTAAYVDSYTFAWWAKFSYSSSTMMWGYSNGNRLNLYIASNTFCLNTGDGVSNPFSGVTVSTTQYGDNNWHHFAITGDGTTAKLYIDGEFKANATTYKPITGTNISFNGWDSSTSYNFNGCLSDFRFYSTPLSTDAIKQLYDTPESIANNGSVLTQGEFVEV